MKKIFLALPLVSLIFTSCMGSSDSIEDAIDYYPVKEESDGKWGFMDKNGEILLSEEFKQEPNVVVNGYFYVREGDNLVLYKAGKKLEVVNGCDELYDAGDFMDGMIPVTKKGERISIIDGSGKTLGVLEPVSGKEIVESSTSFSEGLLRVRTEENKYGFANSKGEYVISPKYDWANDFYDDCTLVGKDNDGDYKYSVIDKKGEELFSLKKDYDPINFKFQYGYTLVRDGDRYVLLNKKGDSLKLPGKVEGVFDYNAKYLIFFNDSYEVGLMKYDEKDQEIVIKAKYSSMTFLPGDKLLVSSDKEYAVINYKGDKIFEFDDDYKSVVPINGSKAKYVAYDGNYYVMLDEKGKPVNKNEFKDITLRSSAYSVSSDYFSAESFASEMLSMVTDNGIGDYYVGEPASKLGLNAKDYTYRSSFENSNLDREGYRYSISFKGECDYSIARSEYNYSYYYSNSSYSYYFNPDSEVEYLMLRGDVPEGFWKDIKAKLTDGLKAKGYKLVKEEKDGDNDLVYFSNSKAGVVIGNEGDRHANLLVCTLSRFNRLTGQEVEQVEVEEVAPVAVAVGDTIY